MNASLVPRRLEIGRCLLVSLLQVYSFERWLSAVFVALTLGNDLRIFERFSLDVTAFGR